MLPDVEEFQSVCQGIFLYEQPYAVGRVFLKPAVTDVKDFVEETPDMETEPASFPGGKGLRVFGRINPSSAGECEFQFVAVVYSLFRRYYGLDFRHIEMSDADQLVVYLLLLRLKLHAVGKRLPFASSACAEMAAERLEPVGRRLHHAHDEAFHVIFFLFGHFHVHNVSGNGELDEKNRAVYPCKGLAFGCNGLYSHILEYDVLFLP